MKLALSFFTLFVVLTYSQVMAKYMITDLKVGTDPSHTIRIYPQLKNVNGIIDIKGTIYWQEDLGNDNTYSVQINRVNPKTNQERSMVNMKGKGVCDALNKFIGGPFQEVARLAKVPNPGQCPIVKGNYTITDWYHLDLNKLPIFGLVPNAIYRLSFRMMNTSGKKTLGTIDFKFNKNI